MTDNEIWDEVYRKIKYGYHRFICVALMDYPNGSRFRERIANLLEGHQTLDSWLISKHPRLFPIGYFDMPLEEKKVYRDKMREARLNWILWLKENP